MKSSKKILLILGGTILLVILLSLLFIHIELKPVSKESDVVEFTVEKNTGKFDIIDNLKNANLIKNKIVTIIYVGVTNKNLQAGDYKLDRATSTKDIINKIATGQIKEVENTLTVTFVEGKTVKDYAKVIEEKFGYDYEEILNIMNDKEYLKELISKYDILKDDILDSNVLYPLEGYLYPSTYEFYKTASIKDIIEKMISETNVVINKYLNNINDQSYSIHELLTIASIVEKEAKSEDNRKGVARVLYNRLDIGMSLGCDVTTYYAVGKDISETLTKKDLSSTSLYNTRNTNTKGLMPGPICNVSEMSLRATLNPMTANYLYFYTYTDVNDNNIVKMKFFESYNDFVVFKNKN